MTRIRLPHSEIPGSKLALSSPRLIAEFYVLHRYWLSRHPLLVPLFTFLCIDLTSNRRLITNSRIYFRNQEGISFIYTNASLYLIFIVVQIVNSTCDLNKSYIKNSRSFPFSQWSFLTCWTWYLSYIKFLIYASLFSDFFEDFWFFLVFPWFLVVFRVFFKFLMEFFSIFGQ